MGQEPGRELINFTTEVERAIRITDADVEPGQEYWFLSKVHYKDNNDHPDQPNYNGGDHHIYFEEPYDSSLKMMVHNETTGETYDAKLEKEPPDPAGNVQIYGGHQLYNSWMHEEVGGKEVPSDKIYGMQLFQNWHASYYLRWEKRKKLLR